MAEGAAVRSIAVKEGLHLSCEFPEFREKLKEVWVKVCLLGNSWPGEEEALC